MGRIVRIVLILGLGYWLIFMDGWHKTAAIVEELVSNKQRASKRSTHAQGVRDAITRNEQLHESVQKGEPNE